MRELGIKVLFSAGDQQRGEGLRGKWGYLKEETLEGNQFREEKRATGQTLFDASNIDLWEFNKKPKGSAKQPLLSAGQELRGVVEWGGGEKLGCTQGRG